MPANPFRRPPPEEQITESLEFILGVAKDSAEAAIAGERARILTEMDRMLTSQRYLSGATRRIISAVRAIVAGADQAPVQAPTDHGKGEETRTP